MTRILIVDDDATNQRILEYTLRKAGYEVRIAGNGVEGLAILKASPVDLVILDLAMPVMDGLTMLRQLRAGPSFATTPVIMLTASGDDNMLQEIEQVTIQGYLTKPSSSRVVLAKIQQVLQGAA